MAEAKKYLRLFNYIQDKSASDCSFLFVFVVCE